MAISLGILTQHFQTYPYTLVPYRRFGIISHKEIPQWDGHPIPQLFHWVSTVNPDEKPGMCFEVLRRDP